jgi:cytoplasmic iron level regulating protein YaaA (DUF328/UPF0246 family)
MKILFAPSEKKSQGGIDSKLTSDSFIFPELFPFRQDVINRYKSYIQSATKEQLEKLFGTKKQDVIDYYKSTIHKPQLLKAIQRYDGVAYEYLKYSNMNPKEQKYIDENVIIFSNLFGAIRAGDKGVFDYKLKQGEKIDSFALESFYKEKFSNSLDSYLKDEEILDLRAGFYEKFYKIDKPYHTMKFIKDGKVVSHFAKAYRGIVLKLLAQNNIDTIEQLLEIKIDNLTKIDINKSKLKTEIVYEIV